MLDFLYGDTLSTKPELARSMFRDRAAQFNRRLGWDVSVNSNGEELDEYDQINPLYVIVSDHERNHQASMRLLPTTGRTMLHDQILGLANGVRIQSPFIWECTRFCASPNASAGAIAMLLAAGGKLMDEFSIEHFIGVFDRKMLSVCRRIGSVPRVMGWHQDDKNEISVGLWQYSHETYVKSLRNCDLSALEMELIFVNSGVAARDIHQCSSLVA